MSKDTPVMPLVPLRGMVVFPYMIVNLDAGRDRSMAALEQAMTDDHKVLLCAQRDASLNDPAENDMYDMGTVAEVKQLVKMPGGSLRVLVEGLYRGRIIGYRALEKFDAVVVERHKDSDEETGSMELEALTRSVVSQFEKWVKLSQKMPAEAFVSVTMMDDVGRLADLIASHLNLKLEEKQELLELVDISERLKKLYAFLEHEIEIIGLERKIGARIRKQIEQIQKEAYLRQKIKAIHQELGDKDGRQAEISEIKKKLEDGKYPDRVKNAIEKELKRMDNMNNYSSELGVIRNYVDWLLELPWETLSEDNINLKKAERILNRDHYGLKKVKERILDYLAVHKLITEQDGVDEKQQKAPILCLVGPPGVGKTSLASSIARAVGREFTRASLGGIRDEAEIRGHRRTYVGAMPGRIIAALKNVGTRNPVFLLDEVDKLSSDYQGDPASALLEVLDPAQNNTFEDHFIDLPFDLSEVFWIVTANDLGEIPRALRDRMEIIELRSYTEQEKIEIAKRYLLPRQIQENGLPKKYITLSSAVLSHIINGYTREAGVRELERVIGKLCRKVARQYVDSDETQKPEKITTKTLETYLDKPRYTWTKANKVPEVGVCTGMAWTEVGGEVLPTEATVLKGKGQLILTGKLGDVMQESARAGLSYIRSRTAELHLPDNFYEKQDIHIHLPEGAVPKDGPSAGITMTLAMISALTNKKVRSDVAMTGEITLRGRVLAIGGLREKVLAAYREGMHTIILPKENTRDIDDIPESVRKQLTFIPVETMDEVLEHVWA
ncbi:MAG: endopeptidase La [Selenomonadaceae bacterium]